MKLGKRTLFERLLAITARFGRADDSPGTPTKSRRCDRSCSAPIRWSSTARTSRSRTGWRRAALPTSCWRGWPRTKRILVGSLRPADGGGHGQPPHHARRGMAARQFLPDRRADPHGQAAPAQGIQPRASAPGARAVRQASARLRPRVRGDLAWRRPGRRGEPFPFRGGLPDGDAAQAGRIVGHSHHAAPGADRESAPRRRPDRGRHDRPQPGRRRGRTR